MVLLESLQDVLAYDVLSEGYKDSAEASANTSITYSAIASTKAQESSDSANIAETAKDTILSYVVPTEATYGSEAIDSKDSSI